MNKFFLMVVTGLLVVPGVTLQSARGGEEETTIHREESLQLKQTVPPATQASEHTSERKSTRTTTESGLLSERTRVESDSEKNKRVEDENGAVTERHEERHQMEDR